MSEDKVEYAASHALEEVRSNASRIWAIAVAVACFAAYFPTLLSLAATYTTGRDSYYAHWFLIPLVSALFVWLKRNTLRQLPVQGCGLGLVVAAGSLLVHVFAVWFRVDFVSAFALVLTIWGFVVYLFGKKIAREIGFPLLFLLFMVPLPQLVISPLAFHMKILSGKMAVALYSIFGGTAVLTGSSINFTQGEPLWMGYECSGLRSVIAMAALGAAFAYLVRGSLARKIALFLFSLPLALISNAVRVTLLCFAADRWGVGSKTFDVFHDASSPVVFILMLTGLFALHKLLFVAGRTKERPPRHAEARQAESRGGAILRTISRRRLVASLVLLAASAVLVFLSPHALTLTQWMSSLRPVELPERVGGWRKVDEEAVGGEGVWSMLNTRSVVLSSYRGPAAKELQVLVVASDTHRNAFHPPEVCMMGAGNEVLEKWREPIELSCPGCEGLYLNAFVLRGDNRYDTLVLYWFMVGEKSMGSRLVQQLILLLNGARRTPVIGSMIRVTVPLVRISEREALASAEGLIGSLAPLMPRVLEAARDRSGRVRD